MKDTRGSTSYMLQFKGTSETGRTLLYCMSQRVHNSNNLLNCFIDYVDIIDPYSSTPDTLARVHLVAANAYPTDRAAREACEKTNLIYRSWGAQ